MPVLAVATVLISCGSNPSARLVTPASGERSVSRSGFPSPVTDSPIPTASGWLMYVNHVGQFTLSAPPDWQIQSCEDESGYLVDSGPCGRGEYYQARLFGVSFSGDQRQALPPNGCSGFCGGTLIGSTEVVVDAVHGFRYTAVIGKSPLGPPEGSKQIYYVFFSGSRTYAFAYSVWPGDRDRSADFDRLVQQTLRFSS